MYYEFNEFGAKMMPFRILASSSAQADQVDFMTINSFMVYSHGDKFFGVSIMKLTHKEFCSGNPCLLQSI